ncbi:hypothetical protein [Streptomyces sp. H27-H5]|uniref:hypothetical protein n=1 Tax=Streptomyces sp. H27-H5 TaxID=2996460 RepID=UPI00226ED3F6|nr:hypothetical protein [Streptomyces sp. H27-H5]MCY0961549.1 hypothetical protein [Streptomyces sp. H27-H5]
MPNLTARAHEHAPTPGRRLIAVGTIRRLDGRTLTVRATAAGVTGSITTTGGAR